jgi:hypothetical protein
MTTVVRALPYLTGDVGLLLLAGGLHSLLRDEGLKNTRVRVLRIPEHKGRLQTDVYSYAGLWIRIDTMRIRIHFRIQGFDEQKI